ncbi:hypothetical protein ACM25O_04180 [Sulfitobacter pontiacus]|jgi:hypothetical protein|tara:strand:- start:302 stop:478 length:177 start_codon:yes stop_codon:yes gene_type:complete
MEDNMDAENKMSNSQPEREAVVVSQCMRESIQEVSRTVQAQPEHMQSQLTRYFASVAS